MLLEYIGKVQTFIALTDPTQIPDVQTSSRQVFRIQPALPIRKKVCPFKQEENRYNI